MNMLQYRERKEIIDICLFRNDNYPLTVNDVMCYIEKKLLDIGQRDYNQLNINIDCSIHDDRDSIVRRVEQLFRYHENVKIRKL